MDLSDNESEIIAPSPVVSLNSDGSPETPIDKCEKSVLQCCYQMIQHFESTTLSTDYVSDNDILRMQIVVDKIREMFNRVSRFPEYLEEVQHDHNENDGRNTILIGDYFIRSLHRNN